MQARLRIRKFLSPWKYHEPKDEAREREKKKSVRQRSARKDGVRVSKANTVYAHDSEAIVDGADGTRTEIDASGGCNGDKHVCRYEIGKITL